MKKSLLTVAALVAVTAVRAQAVNDSTRAVSDSAAVDSAAYWRQFDLDEVNITAAKKLMT